MALAPSFFGADISPTNIVTRDLAGIGILPPQWGIFAQSGKTVVTADAVKGFEYKQDWSLADYPIEDGGFETYDKVQTPFSVRVQFISGGSFSNRQALINSVKAIAADLNLYDVVTPEATYMSCNVMHYDYKRTATNGAGLIEVDVWLQEIRVRTPATLSTTQPSGTDAVSGGQVQTTDTTPAQSQAVKNAFNQDSQQSVTAIGAGA